MCKLPKGTPRAVFHSWSSVITGTGYSQSNCCGSSLQPSKWKVDLCTKVEGVICGKGFAPFNLGLVSCDCCGYHFAVCGFLKMSSFKLFLNLASSGPFVWSLSLCLYPTFGINLCSGISSADSRTRNLSGKWEDFCLPDRTESSVSHDLRAGFTNGFHWDWLTHHRLYGLSPWKQHSSAGWIVILCNILSVPHFLI